MHKHVSSLKTPYRSENYFEDVGMYKPGKADLGGRLCIYLA